MSSPEDDLRNPGSPADAALQVTERIRIQELLRYLQPYELEAHGTSPTSTKKARVSTDSTLTAFAQLSALRLDCERSFISLMDASNQYIIAEATRTVSLQSEDIRDCEKDDIYLGQTVLDLPWGVCPGTIACFTSPDDSLNVTTEYIKASRSYYVMNDMSQLEGFKNRPYIAGWPYMKYYAEVPIHSPSGLTIGTLCVVDDKPRQGLDIKGLRVLEEISEAVMNHLELCVSKIQRNSAERMIHTLGGFLQGDDSVESWWVNAQASRLPQPGQRHLSLDERTKIEFGTGDTDTIERSLVVRPIMERQPHSTITSSTSGQTISNHTSNVNDESSGQYPTTPSPLTTPSTDSSANTTAFDDLEKEAYDKSVEESEALSDIETLLARAAKLVREGSGLDGVMFFDPRSKDGMLLADSMSLDEESQTPAVDQEYESLPASCNVKGPGSGPSKILASSFQHSYKQADLVQLSEQCLHSLLKTFRRGGVLHYDRDGVVGENDTVFSNDRAVTNARYPIRQARDKRLANELQRVFVRATSIILYPMWSIGHDRLIAYSIAFTTNPNRILHGQDFAYLSSFSNSVVTEMSRIDIIAADKAKASFISSISHELRSPLHGIMAGVEVLRDFNIASTIDTIETIESCSSTLLDTMDNLLTFAKSTRNSAHEVTAQPKVQIAHTSVDLAILVEEVAQICIASQSFQRSVKLTNLNFDKSSDDASNVHHDLVVVCDIQVGVAWQFMTDAGIWRRVLLNVLGNALKYTQQGVIVVKLRQDLDLHTNAEQQEAENLDMNSWMPTEGQASTGRGWRRTYGKKQRKHVFTDLSPAANIMLSVEDTGKGISPDYMAHHMFKPFYQENSMNPGTGLGLSIVSHLMSTIGGTISISSEVGIGTKCLMQCVMERSEVNPSTRHSYTFMTIGFLGLNALPNLSEVPSGILNRHSKGMLFIRSSLSAYANDLGLATKVVGSLVEDKVDVLITTESVFRNAQHELRLGQPTIVLAAKPILYGRAATEFKPAIVLSQPYGPREFHRAIDLALSITKHAKEISTVELPLKEEHILPSNKQVDAEILPPLDKRLVLLVEDNPINMKFMIMSVRKLGYAYSTATNGAEAVEAYRRQKHDIILMDIQMPIMDGMEASRAIREHERSTSLAPSIIVALTALTSAQAEQAAIDSGADKFLSKPVSMKKLRDIMGQVLL